MSEPFPDKAQSSMDIAVHSSRPPIPFIEEEEDIEIKSEIKSEMKAEPTGLESPLFVPQQSTSKKRSMEEEICVSDVKKQNISTETGPRAYSGGPVHQYVPGTEYKYTRHEAVPKLEMNSKHHQIAVENFLFSMKEVVLPALSPYKDEDKSVGDSIEWFKKNANVPVLLPTRFALNGSSGSGKTSTLNNLLGMSGLANADAAMESVTQNPQIFNHGDQRDPMFLVEVLLLNGRAVENLVKKCVNDLVDYVKSISDYEAEENEFVRDSAESSRQVIDDLFHHQDGLKSLDDVEEFLETRNLLPQNNEQISESAIQSLYQQIDERASDEGVNLVSREIHLTAGNIGELHARTAKFSERGAFAPLVSSIRTKFYSPLMSMGVEIADLPGFTDTNMHLRKTSKNYSENCTKSIFVADLARCLTTPELKKSLKETIKIRGAENVCLVLRGKENVEKSKSKWRKDESVHIDTLERSLKTARSQLDSDTESIEAATEVQKIERQILNYRIAVRDRIIADHFSQKEFQNKHDAGKIRVITVANKCHEQYMLGTKKAILPADMTGIKDLRAYMCETPSKDRVRAFARHSANCITKMRRISIWAAGPKMPPRDAAMALFEQHTRWNIQGHKTSLIKASTHYKKLLNARVSSTWEDAARKVMDGWTTSYAARTQGVFIRQGGRHSPNVKGAAKTKKPELVSWIEHLLVVAEDDVPDLLKSTSDAINEVEASICESVRDVVKKIRHGLDMLDTIGGANLEEVFTLFEAQRNVCIRDIEEGITKLKSDLRSTVVESIADEPCDEDSPIFVKEMVKIFKSAFAKHPPKSKNVTKERMKYIKEQVVGDKGPYTMMSTEIVTRMVPVINEWAIKTNARVGKLHEDLGDVLFKSFEGKKMPDARREQVAPAIKLAMEKAMAVLQADLDGYATDIL